MLLAVLGTGVGYVASLPSVADAKGRATRLVATRGDRLGSLRPPTKLGESVVAVEDEHFYDNFALNVTTGVVRFVGSAITGGPDPGGSTIDQQLAKVLYLPRGSGLGADLEELGLATKLDLSYSKPEILGLYLDTVYYGNGYRGASAAARGYFGTPPASLTWAQASLLAGLPRDPSAYDPVRHPKAALARRRHVLDQLAVNGYLRPSRARAIASEPLGLRPSVRSTRPAH